MTTIKPTFMTRRHDDTTVYVSIDASRAPPCGLCGCVTCDPDSESAGAREDCNGHDWGNANWPTDAEIAKAAGVPAVRFFDGGETLAEAVYTVVTP